MEIELKLNFFNCVGIVNAIDPFAQCPNIVLARAATNIAAAKVSTYGK